MKSMLVAIMPVLAACQAHRASVPAGSSSQVPMFVAPKEIYLGVGVTPVDERRPMVGFHLGGRVSERFGFGWLSEASLESQFDSLLPAFLIGPEFSIFFDPLRIDLTGGVTQSSVFVATRIGVGHQLRWDEGRWGLRFWAAVIAGLPTECDDCSGETHPTIGGEASIVFGARLAGVEVAIGPQVGVVWPEEAASTYWMLVLQIEAAIDGPTGKLSRGAPD